MQAVHSLARDYPGVILEPREGPCLSLYQPTSRSHPERQQDPIRFKNLLRRLVESMQSQYPDDEIEPLVAPLHAMADDVEFWNHSLDGLVVLAAADVFRVYRVQRTVPELAIVADSFHSKPLLRIMQSADRYQILGVNRHEARLFEGNRYQLDEVDPASAVPESVQELLDYDTERDRGTRTHGPIRSGSMGQHGASDVKQDAVRADTEQFFRALDGAIVKHHSQPSGLPLLLAALPENGQLFRSLSGNPNLLDAGIDTYPDDLDLDELRQRAWNVLEPRYLERLGLLIDRFQAGRQRDQASDVPAEVARAAVAGRVDVLLLDAGQQMPGRLDQETGDITLGKLEDPDVDDLLDDIGERVLATGGEVVVVPSERMPAKTGLAAVYRF